MDKSGESEVGQTTENQGKKLIRGLRKTWLIFFVSYFFVTHGLWTILRIRSRNAGTLAEDLFTQMSSQYPDPEDAEAMAELEPEDVTRLTEGLAELQQDLLLLETDSSYFSEWIQSIWLQWGVVYATFGGLVWYIFNRLELGKAWARIVLLVLAGLFFVFNVLYLGSPQQIALLGLAGWFWWTLRRPPVLAFVQGESVDTPSVAEPEVVSSSDVDASTPDDQGESS